MHDPLVIAPSGELDLHASRALAPELERVATGDGELLIDLSEVSFVDSLGLGAILQVHRRLSQQGRAMAVVAPQGSAAAVLLNLSGLGRRLPVYPSRQAALTD
jgi:anti-sigma B factor antagonist